MDRVLRALRSTVAPAGPAAPRCNGYCRVHGRAGFASVARSGRSLRRACLHAVVTALDVYSSRSGFGPLPPIGRSAASCRVSRLLRQSRQGGGRLRSAKFLFTPPATPLPALPASPARFGNEHQSRSRHALRLRRSTGRAGGGVADEVNKNLAERSRPPRRRPRAARFPARATACGETTNGSNGPIPADGRPALQASRVARCAVEQLT